MIHELKILPMFFEAVISGKKTFEIRKADRPYKVGDLLALNEYDNGYTGNSCIVYIDYILNDKVFCRDGYVTMSIKPCAVWKQDAPFDRAALKYDYSVPYATRRSDGNDESEAN